VRYEPLGSRVIDFSFPRFNEFASESDAKGRLRDSTGFHEVRIYLSLLIVLERTLFTFLVYSKDIIMLRIQVTAVHSYRRRSFHNRCSQ
jgi:hypothetical protein